MAKDADGNDLQVGDNVVIHGTVVEVSDHEETYCDVEVETKYKPSRLYLNCGQLIKDDPHSDPAPAPTPVV